MPANVRDRIRSAVHALIISYPNISISELCRAFPNKHGGSYSRSTMHGLASEVGWNGGKIGRPRKARPIQSLEKMVRSEIRSNFYALMPKHLLIIMRFRTTLGVRLNNNCHYCVDALVRIDPQPHLKCQLLWRPLERNPTDERTPHVIYRDNLRKSLFDIMRTVGNYRRVQFYSSSHASVVLSELKINVKQLGLESIVSHPLFKADPRLDLALRPWLREIIAEAICEANAHTCAQIQTHVDEAWKRVISEFERPVRL